MSAVKLTPETAHFVLLSFEGPDPYSMVGGLGTRVTELSAALAARGFYTHLVFVGDPYRPGEEHLMDGRLILHRWCQWISARHPAGCYDGETEKVEDFNASLPGWIAHYLVQPAATEGRTTVVIAEDWQTARAICNLSWTLLAQGVRSSSVLAWNANNDMGFDGIDFGRLVSDVTPLAVSRFMKHSLWKYGANPIVVPNGIPARLIRRYSAAHVKAVREALGNPDVLLAKVGRWDPDKNWHSAVDALARLKAMGLNAKMIAKGGRESFEAEVIGRVQGDGLTEWSVFSAGREPQDILNALRGASHVDFLNCKFFIPEEFLGLLYNASDGVLANSGYEPFGLVGLEAMAAGGVAYTGSTGEDYARPFDNAIVLETGDPDEIAAAAVRLREHPEEAQAIRKAGRRTAEAYTWDRVVDQLLHKLEYVAIKQTGRVG